MPSWQGTRRLAVATACMNASGCPGFALTEVEVTQEQADNGVHYYLTEAELLEAGFEEPFVHFDEGEAPAFLHPAVRRHLGLPPATDPTATALSEDRRCPA